MRKNFKDRWAKAAAFEAKFVTALGRLHLYAVPAVVLGLLFGLGLLNPHGVKALATTASHWPAQSKVFAQYLNLPEPSRNALLQNRLIGTTYECKVTERSDDSGKAITLINAEMTRIGCTPSPKGEPSDLSFQLSPQGEGLHIRAEGKRFQTLLDDTYPPGQISAAIHDAADTMLRVNASQRLAAR